MTNTLTLGQIRDAQNNGLSGTSAVLEAMNGRLDKLADAAARRMFTNGYRFEEHREDFRQDAALAMFEALPRFSGDTVDGFFGFMWATVEGVLLDKVRSMRNQGADADAIKVFASMLEKADGDVFLAEKFAQTVPPKGRRLSADRAEAARLAWQGTASLDLPAIGNADQLHYSVSGGGSNTGTVGEALADSMGLPEDLLTADDITSEERRQKHAVVNAILDSMSANQAAALRHSYGIGGVECFGTGDAGDLPGLAAKLGLEVIQARDARVKGHKSFAKRYIKAVATSEDEAKELEAAAAINLGRGGRK